MNTELQLYGQHAPITSVDSYIARVNAIPMLTAEEEYQLAKQLQDQGDLNAAQALIAPHLRFVVRVARGYLGYGLALADLIQEGNIGLMKAVKRFNPEVGVRLVSYAVHWIKAEIHEFVLRNWRIVKIATTKAQRKLFFNLRSQKKRLGWFSQDEINGVAKDLGVSPEEVTRMEATLNARDASFDTPLIDDEDHTAPSYFLEDHSSDPAQQLENDNWAEHGQQQLAQAMAQLSERDRTIVAKRWLAEKKATLHELAAEFKVSAERIRQLEQNAMKKLKAAIKQ